jgi:uncharacterized protein YndB with AHSA1/START domain
VADHDRPVELELTIAARPETVFRYFTDPARFARWLGEAAVLEPRAGGRLRVGYPTGQVAGGRVLAVEPDRRVAFTWGYEGDGQVVPAGSSTVEITLEPVAEGTLVRLRHTGLPAGEPPTAHLAGWRHALAGLAFAASTDQLAPVLAGRVADWLAAWTSPTRPPARPCSGAAWPTAGASATPPRPSTAPARWPSTSARSASSPAGPGWWVGAVPSSATAWSASAGRSRGRARRSWPPGPTWPGPTWTAGSAG